MDLGLEIQKTNVWIRINISRYHVCQFSGKTDNFDFFGSNLPKNKFWDRNFKNLSPDLKWRPPRYYVCQFQRTTLKFLAKIWGNCLITCDILFLVTLRVLQRAGWKLKWAGWRWMELREGRWSWVKEDGARKRWVHGLAIPKMSSRKWDVFLLNIMDIYYGS